MDTAAFAERETYFPGWADRMIVTPYGAPRASSEIARCPGFYTVRNDAAFAPTAPGIAAPACTTPAYGAPRASSEIAACAAFYDLASFLAFAPRPAVRRFVRAA